MRMWLVSLAHERMRAGVALDPRGDIADPRPGVADVDLLSACLASVAADLRRGCLDGAGVHIRHDEVRTFERYPARGPGGAPRRRADHDDNLSVEPVHLLSLPIRVCWPAALITQGRPPPASSGR